jgi:hypothetical protein
MSTISGSSERGSGNAVPAGRRPTAGTIPGSSVRRLWAWLTDTGYRPERHYYGGHQIGDVVGAGQ